MGNSIKLDVRGLPPPEPFINIMQALQTLPRGTPLLVMIHREPFPLYDALHEAGFTWQTSVQADESFQIAILHTV
jgi:uncharacterized protein (DUF2249 family)